MCPSYKLVVRLIRPILDRPKSVSLMWPIEVIRRLRTDTAESNSSCTSDVLSFLLLKTTVDLSYLSGLRSRCTMP